VRATPFGVLVNAEGVVAAKSLLNNEAHLDEMLKNAKGLQLIDRQDSRSEEVSVNSVPI
jgi:hypothetical protein